MKKTIFTLAAVAFLAVAGQAQDKSSKKEKATTSKEVKNDGTVTQSGDQQAQPKEEKKKGGTRMAINEKGMPGNAGKKEQSSSSTKKD